jgi:hypothetical protein
MAPGAKREIAAAQGSLGGSGFIQAGSICSWISVGLTAAGLVIGLFVLLIAMASS